MKNFDYYSNTELIENCSDIEALLKLKKPTLFKINGKDHSKAVLVSVLLHGSEPCGFRAILREISKYKQKYNFDVYLLVGNVVAAKIKPYFSNRGAKGENFNRIWTETPKNEHEEIAHSIYEFLENLPVIAVLDLHSFTAKNNLPHCIISYEDNQTLQLAKNFAQNILLMDFSSGALIQRIGKKCSSIVVECGTNLTKEADNYAFESLQKFLIYNHAKEGNIKTFPSKLLSECFSIKVKKESSITWSDKKENREITLRKDIENLNLKEVKTMEFLGWTDNLNHFRITSKKGNIEPSEIFEIKQEKLYLKDKATPNLLSTSEFIIKESGFYLFKKIINT